MKIRFGKVESRNLFSKVMIGFVTKKLKKEFPIAFEGLLQGMQDFAKTIYQDNLDLDSKPN